MDEVATLRSFNRSYTQRIGVLAESYLDSGRPLGSSRVLFEIGTAGARAAELRLRLGLDSGYLSRLLRQLEEEDLVRVIADPADGRQRIVELSPAGQREWRRLDHRSDAAAWRLIEPLSAGQRAELASALAIAERLLRTATVEIDVVDAGSAVAQHALATYFAELEARFRAGFDLQAVAADDSIAMGPPDGAFLVMRSDDAIVGCGGIQRFDDRTAEIKRMWIDPGWRSLGLGRRLLARLEDTGCALGHGRVILDTNESLTEAISMYQRAGYLAIERYNDNPYAHHWFAKGL